MKETLQFFSSFEKERGLSCPRVPVTQCKKNTRCISIHFNNEVYIYDTFNLIILYKYKYIGLTGTSCSLSD